VVATIQHLALTVAEPSRTAAYFAAALAPLGAIARPASYTSDRGERPLVVAVGHSLSLMLHPAADQAPAPDRYRAGAMHHLGIHVDRAGLVDEVAAAAVAAGGQATDGPRWFPEYRFGYYGAFLRDPDDLKWEVFCYTELAEPGDARAAPASGA
jgi:catechol 2,3-dioxygenase-like lactoylglutathione lyase family enzyme